MSSYADRLSQVKGKRFPSNPCKFLKVWVQGDKEKYDEIMGAIFLDGYELSEVATVLNDDLSFSVGRTDVWKHRNFQCIGCRIMFERDQV